VLPAFKSRTVHKITIEYLTLGLLSSLEICIAVQQLTFLDPPCIILRVECGSVAEWLACWTQAQKGPSGQVQIAVATLSGNSLRQTVHTHRASIHQAAKLVAALFKGCGGNCGPGEK